MIPNAQPVAIDLSRMSSQVSDSTSNIVEGSEPDGSFAALLQSPPSADGQEPTGIAGSSLPASGSELPVEENAVPAPEYITDFVAYYEGDDDSFLQPGLADGIMSDAATALAESDAATGLTGIAPPQIAELATGSQTRRDGRDDGRMDIRPLDGRGFSRRDHGRMALAQPMSPPERMIFRSAGAGSEIALNAESAQLAGGRELLAGDNESPILDRQNPGLRMQGLMPLDQVQRVPGEPAGGFEMPVLRDGADSAARLSTAVQISAAVGQVAELSHSRDLAGVAKPTPVFTSIIDRPVMDDAWGEAFQDRVLWMAKGRIQNAEIRLNPAELGPIRVQVSVEDDAAMLNFTAQHNVTREAIEQAMPRLREMLSENGLTLAGSTVTDSNDPQAEDDRNASLAEVAAETEQDAGDGVDTGPALEQRVDSSSLVDTFA